MAALAFVFDERSAKQRVCYNDSQNRGNQKRYCKWLYFADPCVRITCLSVSQGEWLNFACILYSILYSIVTLINIACFRRV